MNISTQYDADVIVVGAGVVGASFACLLAKAGLRVIVLDAKPRSSFYQKAAPSRIFTLTIASEHILRQAGLSQGLTQYLSAFKQIYVWDDTMQLSFNSAHLCKKNMGYTIAHNSLMQALIEQLETVNNIELLWSTTPSDIDIQDEHVAMRTQKRTQLKARLLIAADGKSSSVRSQFKIDHLQCDYDQLALNCIVNTELPHADTARQCFLSTGPLALLPMADPHQSALVWSSSSLHVQDLLAMDKKTFQIELAKACGSVLGDITDSTKRLHFPLSRGHATNYITTRVALLGESAHHIHPLAGLGANIGLLDVATLAQIVIEAYQQGADIGLKKYLRRYERWRKTENKQLMLVVDGMKWLFESRCGGIKKIRNIGISALDNTPSMKKYIMYRAMGLSGNLPRFAIGDRSI